MSTDTAPSADFSFIRYANCWEDAELLVEALEPAPGKRILSIASAGDNLFRLLADGCEIVAVDLNAAQLAAVELRKAAIKNLSYYKFLRFAGIEPCGSRPATYKLLRSDLSTDARAFWDSQGRSIEKGFIFDGKFERYFSLFRKQLIPLIHSKKTVAKLLEPKTREERITFYNKKWNNARWQMIFRLFFSRKLMGVLGRDPSFFKQVEGKVSSKLLERAEYALTELDTSNNPYLTFILTGSFSGALPPYLEVDNYLKIQSNTHNLTIHHGTVQSALTEYEPQSFDGFNLSDIFEYLTEEESTEVYGELLKSAKPSARLAYWNMLAPRECPLEFSDKVEHLSELSESLFKKDRAFFYSRFIVDEVK